MSTSKSTSKNPKATTSFPGQHDDEEVLLVFRQHPMVMRKPLIFGLGAVVLAVVPFDFPQVYAYPWLTSILTEILIGVPLLVLVWWFIAWVGWWYSIYIVTGMRILEIRQSGLFNRRVSEWQLEMVQNVNYHIKGLQGVLFSVGDITAQTFSGDLVMPKIHHPVRVHDQLMRIVHGAGGGSTPAAVSGSIS